MTWKDSSYDIVQVQAKPRRRPRAPTTVQILPDDFDAMTQDYETAAPTEVFQHDGVTEVKTMEDGMDPGADDGLRYSRVYGEWAARHEVHRQEEPWPADVEKYMEEVSRRLQEVGVDEQGNFQDVTIRARGGMAPRLNQPQPQQAGDVGRGGKVSVWREEVARNEVALGEFGESVAGTDIRQSRERTYTMDQATIKPKGVETTLRRIPSSATQSAYRSERMYTPLELKPHGTPKPPKVAAITVKRTRDPSPARSERMYTWAELNALAVQSLKNSSPHCNTLNGQELHSARTASSSPPQNVNNKIKASPTLPSRCRSSSTSSIEGVLMSCQPSLLHIAPVLSNLGIRRREHLRAFARLREETRDREMKEEVLKQGVTMLEWAILVDKIQEL